VARSNAPRPTLVVATSNRGKLDELRLLLARLPLDVRAIGDVLAYPPPVVEDGSTFEQNAIKKARAAAEATGMMAVADDSGLEVDALDGRPGVRSARFAGDHATDAENNTAVLAAIGASGKDAPLRCRFRCVLALVDPWASTPGAMQAVTVDGVCEGTITLTPRGTEGFGYDPVFVVEGTDKTMAELTRAEKNTLSHRARAFAALLPVLERIVTSRTDRSALRTRGR
jgi:XTP/dITP diphosphohydrolase